MIKIFILLLCCTIVTYSQKGESAEQMYPSYKGLVMCGYQGWFRADGDEDGRGWGHYGRRGKFDTDHVTIDIWPDVTEYEILRQLDIRHEKRQASIDYARKKQEYSGVLRQLE